jgi:hypothetical protein
MAGPGRYDQEMAADTHVILRSLPTSRHFPGPDELDRWLSALAAAHPGLVRRQRIGTSRLGDPITMYTIGSGDRDALVFAGPHPNEPIGFLTITHLAELLTGAADGSTNHGYTWHLIGCVDPDGARLNEGWYGGPFTRSHYSRNLFRPPLQQQPEWTFPNLGDTGYFDRVLPETLALIRAIDLVRPDLMCSLHNREFGGVYYYITEELPDLAEKLAALTTGTGIPLHHGDAELPGARSIRPGVFFVPNHQVVQDMVGGELGQEARFGMSSLHYAQRHDTFSLVVEVPLWSDERSGMSESCGERLAEVLTSAADDLAKVSPAIGEHIDAVSTLLKVPTSPFATSLADLRKTTDGLAAAMRSHAGTADRVASISDLFEFRQTVHMLRLRGAGTALRLLDGEFAVGNLARPLREAHRRLNEVFEQWVDDADADGPGDALALEEVAGLQLRAILTAAASVAEHKARKRPTAATARTSAT